MNDMSQVDKDKLVADLKVVVADAEELLRLTAGQAGDKLTELRTRMNDRLAVAKVQLGELEAVVKERTKQVARVTDDYVHDNPWKALGAAASLAFLLGLLVGRR